MEKSGETKRLIRGNQSDVAGELQTSIVRYQEKSPNQLFNRKLQVDLVGIIHTGDERYYKKIQNRLRSYDCVLYEGVEEERQIRWKELENQQGRKIKIKQFLQIMLDL
ncbi:hypothetical protein FCM35_KLT00527 [Carex littledalei]|uniref:Uncharacterized protein n=1 Tax=Carex littledalei TaxID=544730 RepID=A0A833RIM0_9POAL|nr:hypothetical protein FCM35_KLT00527 [Carex littledalei]